MRGELCQLYEKESFSKIVSLDKASKFHSVEYSRIAELAKKGTPKSEGKHSNNSYYNITDCSEFTLDDESIEKLSVNLSSMLKDGHYFLPIVEQPQEYSNFSCVIDTNIKYVSGQYRYDDDDINSYIVAICKRIYKDLKVKTTTDVCIYIRCYDKKVYLKVHMLKYLLDFSNRVHLLDIVKECVSKISADNGLFSDCYLQTFNEIYETSAFPCIGCTLEHYHWKLINVFECKNKFGVSISPIDKNTFLSKIGISNETAPGASWLNTLSVNDLESDYGKEIYNRELPKIAVSSESLQERYQLMFEINKYPKLEFFDLVLRYLPDELRTYKHLKDIIISLRLEHNTLLLAKHFFRENYKPEEDSEDIDSKFYSIWNSRYKVSVLGFCAFEAKKNKDFNRELLEMLERLIERYSFEEGGCVNDTQQALIIELMFYGKYYTFTEVSGRTKILVKYSFIDNCDECEEKLLYKWAQFEDSKPIINFITGDLRDIFSRVIGKLDIAGNIEAKKMNKKEKSYSKMVKALTAVKRKLGDDVRYNAIMRTLNRNIKSQLFIGKIDSDKDIIGVLNGVLHLDLDSDNPKPYLYTGYSPFVVTRSADAEYIPYEQIKGKTRYLHIIKNALREIFPDNESRKKVLSFLSTALDEKAVKCVALIIIGWGGNGKSLLLDWLLELLGGYGQKVSPKLFTEGAQSGKADPELMQLRNARLAYAAETSRGDSINAGRLKQVTEAKKPGRDLFGGMESITPNPTYVISTNFELAIRDRDDGTNRRIMCLYFPYHFVHNPDPDNPLEKKIDTTLPGLITRHVKARTELFSWLVHLRCKFQRKYKSVIDRVPSVIMDRDTNNYKCEQDILSKFISTKLVILQGYTSSLKLRTEEGKTEDELRLDIDKYYESEEKTISHTLSMEFIIKSYIEWTKRVLGEEIKGNYNNILKDFLLSGLGKFIQGEDTLATITGVRVLEHGLSKLEGEIFVSCARRS